MKCNICGGDIPSGDFVCPFCGNKVIPKPQNNRTRINEKKTEVPNRKPVVDSAPKKDTSENHSNVSSGYLNYSMPPRSESDEEGETVVHTPDHSKDMYCRKCGRPLDGVTHRCVICDSYEVSRDGYRNRISSESERSEDSMASKKPKKKKHTALIIILSVLGLMLLFAVALYLGNEFIGSSKDEEVATMEPNNMTIVTRAPGDDATETPPPTMQPTEKIGAGGTKKQPATNPPKATATSKPTTAPVTDAPTNGDPAKTLGGSYVFDSHDEIITSRELSKMNEGEIRLVYFEMYARYNMTFDDDDLIEYFESRKWYRPSSNQSLKEIEEKFNSTEKANKELIEQYVDSEGLNCLESY